MKDQKEESLSETVHVMMTKASRERELGYCKRFKASEPDLEVVCRKTSDDDGSVIDEKAFHCHSFYIMIFRSTVFDSMLGSGMKEASEKKEIHRQNGTTCQFKLETTDLPSQQYSQNHLFSVPVRVFAVPLM